MTQEKEYCARCGRELPGENKFNLQRLCLPCLQAKLVEGQEAEKSESF
jgi:ribosomal protein S14